MCLVSEEHTGIGVVVKKVYSVAKLVAAVAAAESAKEHPGILKRRWPDEMGKAEVESRPAGLVQRAATGDRAIIVVSWDEHNGAPYEYPAAELAAMTTAEQEAANDLAAILSATPAGGEIVEYSDTCCLAAARQAGGGGGSA